MKIVIDSDTCPNLARDVLTDLAKRLYTVSVTLKGGAAEPVTGDLCSCAFTTNPDRLNGLLDMDIGTGDKARVNVADASTLEVL
jgi:hypothetical protein